MKRSAPKAFEMLINRSHPRQIRMDPIYRQARKLCRVLRTEYCERKGNQIASVLLLLAGPPGIGKAAAAKLIASEMGRPLYRIDLSSVVSKYIRETEENLQKLFERVENADVVLLFDEADAMLGKRTEVGEAANRYATPDATALMERIEAYSGIVILSTNFIENLDPAIRDRARFVLEVSSPESDGRQAPPER
jgi:SpoVK/Ycf46/Vps4 family AAA+-type ATPase